MIFKFEVTEQEANLILQALGELPAKFTIDLILKLKEQAKNELSKCTKN